MAVPEPARNGVPPLTPHAVIYNGLDRRTGLSISWHMVMGNHKPTLSIEIEFVDPRKTNGL